MAKYDDVLKQWDQIESLKAAAIKELLAEREAIDAKLARLGHGGVKARRRRRTKAEMAAERAKAKK